jgi:hypothetical protein
MRQHHRWRFRIDRKNALLLLFPEIRLKLFPNGIRALGGIGKEFFVAAIRRNVADDEVANVDRVAPGSMLKAPPARLTGEILCD